MTEPPLPSAPLPEISPARLDEMPQILAWNAQTWEAHAIRQPENFPSDRRGVLQDAIRASFRGKSHPEAESESILAARIAGRMVGYLHFSAALGQTGLRAVSLDDICVDPAYRGQGIGRLLLARAVQEKDRQGWESLTAFTWGGNAASSATFAASAFRQDFTLWRFGTFRPASPVSPWRARLVQMSNVLPWIALGYLAARLLPHLLR